jgi:hypothetical protein
LATPQDVFKAATKAIIDANIVAATPKIKAEAVKEYKKTQEARTKLDADREVNAANGSRPRPTNGAGGSVSSGFQPRTILELDTAIAEGRVPAPTRAEFNRMTRGLPYS